MGGGGLRHNCSSFSFSLPDAQQCFRPPGSACSNWPRRSVTVEKVNVPVTWAGAHYCYCEAHAGGGLRPVGLKHRGVRGSTGLLNIQTNQNAVLEWLQSRLMLLWNQMWKGVGLGGRGGNEGFNSFLSRAVIELNSHRGAGSSAHHQPFPPIRGRRQQTGPAAGLQNHRCHFSGSVHCVCRYDGKCSRRSFRASPVDTEQLA